MISTCRCTIPSLQLYGNMLNNPKGIKNSAYFITHFLTTTFKIFLNIGEGITTVV